MTDTSCPSAAELRDAVAVAATAFNVFRDAMFAAEFLYDEALDAMLAAEFNCDEARRTAEIARDALDVALYNAEDIT